MVALISLVLLPWSSSVLEESSDVGLLPGLWCVFEAELPSDTLPLDVPLDDSTFVEGPVDVGMLGPVGALGPVDAGTLGPVEVETLGPVDAGTLGPVDVETLGPVDAGTLGPVDVETIGPVDTGTLGPVDETPGPVDAGALGPVDVESPGFVDTETLGPVETGGLGALEDKSPDVRGVLSDFSLKLGLFVEEFSLKDWELVDMMFDDSDAMEWELS